MNIIRKSAAVVAILVSSLALAACAPTGSAPDAGSTTANRDFNDQDVLFVQGMLPHHEQAVEMSDMILAKEGIDPQVVEIAQKIKEEQEPEINLMTGWLEDWDATASMGGVDHGSGGMGGMMSDDDMADLESAASSAASELFLTQMTAHHTGAIEMAQTEIDAGQSAPAIDLAQSIVSTQQAEIDEMKQILASL